MARCNVCGQVLIDDMEVGQGYCITAPCWMYATGQIELVEQWEEENPEFWTQEYILDGLGWLCGRCGAELDEYDKTCPHCDDNDRRDWERGLDNPA